MCSFCEHTKWESLVGHRVSHVLLEDILRSLNMFLLCVGSARYVRGFTCFISHNNKKLKFFCCQFTIDHNQGILFKAFRCKQCGGAIGGGMDPNKSSSKDKKKKKRFSRKVVSVWGGEIAPEQGRHKKRNKGKVLMRMEEGENNSQRRQHIDGGDCPFNDLLLTRQILIFVQVQHRKFDIKANYGPVHSDDQVL